MNKQVSYITSAHIILIGIATGYFFISKISAGPTTLDYEIPNDNARIEKKADLSGKAAKGKILFMSKCASCHNIFKDMTGPSLAGIIDNEQWADRKRLYEWIRNPETFMKKDAYTRELRKQYGVMMTGFPNLTDEEINAILEYVSWQYRQMNVPVPAE